MIMQRYRWPMTSVALALLGAFGLTRPGATASAQTTASLARSQVRALARLEPEPGLIVIGAQPGARIAQVATAEGRDVQKGDLLAVLDGHDQRVHQLALAEAQRDAARFQRRLRREQLALERIRFDRLKQPRLESLRSTVNDLKSKLGSTAGTRKGEPGEKTKDAQEKPATPAFGGMFPPAASDMLIAQLRAELAKTEIQLKELEVSLDLLDRQRKLEDEQVADHAPDVTVLDRQVELARADLSQSELRAPAGGRVLAVLAHAGEVSAGPILMIGDVRSMIARAEVFETDVLDVAVGDPAEVMILGRAVAGEVTRVGTTVSRNKITSLDPTALADRRVVEVIVRLADPSIASRLVNMQVDVAIRRRPAGGTTR